MAVAALGLTVGWLVVVIGLRMVVQARRTGDSGLRRQRNSRIESVSHLLMAAAVLLGIAGPVAGVLGLDPIPPLTGTGVRVAGLVIGVLGVALTLAAQLGMGESWRIGVDPGERTALVTGGLFALVRNPVFTAALLTSAGVALAAGNVITLLGVLALATAVELQVRRVEEPYLRDVHGTDYRAYSARVGRFVPGIGRVRS